MVPPVLQSATTGAVVTVTESVLTTASVKEQKRLLPRADEVISVGNSAGLSQAVAVRALNAGCGGAAQNAIDQAGMGRVNVRRHRTIHAVRSHFGQGVGIANGGVSGGEADFRSVQGAYRAGSSRFVGGHT